MLSRIKPFLSKLGACTTPRNRGGGSDKQKSYLSHSLCLSEAIYCDSKRISPRSRASLRPLDELPAPYVSFECDFNAWLGWVMLNYQRDWVWFGHELHTDIHTKRLRASLLVSMEPSLRMCHNPCLGPPIKIKAPERRFPGSPMHVSYPKL